MRKGFNKKSNNNIRLFLNRNLLVIIYIILKNDLYLRKS